MTADEPRVRVTTNLAFGICLILLGTTLILDRLQLVPASQLLRFWPVGLVLVGAALVIQSFQRVDPAQARSQQGFDGGHIFALIIFAIIMSQVFNRGAFTARADASETVNLFALMTHHQQVSSAAVFRGGEMTSVMGHSDLDLRKTTVAPGEEAVIEVFIRERAEVHVIPVAKIDYFESQDDYVAVKCGERSYLKEQTLGDLEAQLDPTVFVRIHRRYVLNLARLARIELGVTDSRIAVLGDATQLPISRTGYARLRALL